MAYSDNRKSYGNSFYHIEQFQTHHVVRATMIDQCVNDKVEALLCQVSTIHFKGTAGNKGTVVCGQEHESLGDLLRFAKAFHRMK